MLDLTNLHRDIAVEMWLAWTPQMLQMMPLRLQMMPPLLR
jgi:hypothetical protein